MSCAPIAWRAFTSSLSPSSVSPHSASASISHGPKHPFEASKHGEQAGSICGELLRLGALQSVNTVDKIVSKHKVNPVQSREPSQITRAGETKDIEPEHSFGMGQSVPPVKMFAGKPCIIVPESPCPCEGKVGQEGLLLFIGTRLVTHALSCVHSAFASCERSFEKKKEKKKILLLPSPSGPLPQFRCVSHLRCPPPSAGCNLPPALGSFQPPPPAFCPHPLQLSYTH